MVRRKAGTRKTTTIVTEDGTEAGSANVPESGSTDVFSRAMAAFGADPDGIKLQVFRMESGEDDAWLEAFDYDPELHDAEFMRTRFGPGKYRLKFRDRDYRYKMQQKISIAARAGDPDPASSSPASASYNDRLLEILLADRNRSEENFTKLVTGLLLRDSNGGGAGSSVNKLMEVMSAQNTALLNTLLTARSGGSPGESILKALEAGLRVASEVKSDSEGGWLGFAKSLTRDIGPVLAQVLSQRPPVATPVPGVTVPTAPATAGAISPPSSPEVSSSSPSSPSSPAPDDVNTVASTFQGYLTRTLPIVEAWAKEGMDPADAAGEILDSVGLAYHPLFDSLQIQDVLTYQPSLGEFQTHDGRRWIDQVLDHLRNRESLPSGSEGGESEDNQGA